MPTFPTYDAASNIKVYIKAFDTDLTATAATVPTEILDDAFEYDAEFDTGINLNHISIAYKVDATTPEKLTIISSGIDYNYDINEFKIAESVYKAGGNRTDLSPNENNGPFFSLTSGVVRDTAPYLMDEYISYLAYKLLGSQFLAGAFDNIPELQNSIKDNGNLRFDTTVKQKINDALNHDIIEIDNYFDLHNNTNALDDSPLSQVFYSVLKNQPERLIPDNDHPQGSYYSLLSVGDILELKFVVNTPITVDDSIKNIHDASWTVPIVAPRTYKVNIHIL